MYIYCKNIVNFVRTYTQMSLKLRKDCDADIISAIVAEREKGVGTTETVINLIRRGRN